MKSLPFDDVSPLYSQWWNENKPHRARVIYAREQEFLLDYKTATLSDVVDLIERGSILLIDWVGIYLTRQHIETFYKHGIVSESWYREQMEIYK